MIWDNSKFVSLIPLKPDCSSPPSLLDRKERPCFPFKCRCCSNVSWIANFSVFSSSTLIWSFPFSLDQVPPVFSPWQYAPKLPLMHPIYWGGFHTKNFHCLSSNCEPTTESLLCFEKIMLFVFRWEGQFFIRLFVVSVGNDTWEELAGLPGQLRVMSL